MSTEQIFDFKLRWPGPPRRRPTGSLLLQPVIFMTKQKPLRKIFEWIVIYC